MVEVPTPLLYFRHPELGVLMCTKCYKCYGRGGWTKDGEGNDEYRRYLKGPIFLFIFRLKGNHVEIACHRWLCILVSFIISGGAQKEVRSTFVTIARRWRAFSRLQGLNAFVANIIVFQAFCNKCLRWNLGR